MMKTENELFAKRVIYYKNISNYNNKTIVTSLSLKKNPGKY